MHIHLDKNQINIQLEACAALVNWEIAVFFWDTLYKYSEDQTRLAWRQKCQKISGPSCASSHIFDVAVLSNIYTAALPVVTLHGVTVISHVSSNQSDIYLLLCNVAKLRNIAVVAKQLIL